MAKATIVTLECNGVDRDFVIDKAESLLRYEAQIRLSNWKLKDDKYIFEDGVIKRANSKPNQKSTESEVDTEGDNTSE
jgi:hypothetical protein